MNPGWWFLGMHVFWWLFWLVLILAFTSLFTPVPRQQSRRETPLELLQRRYAAGEISSQEYEERRAVLLRDGGSPST